MNHRRESYTGISDTARYNNLAALFDCFYDRLGTEIDIGRADAGTNVKEILPRFHVGEALAGSGEFVEVVDDIVAVDDADFDIESLGNLTISPIGDLIVDPLGNEQPQP